MPRLSRALAPELSRPLWATLLVAMGTVVLATVARIAFPHVLASYAPFITFFPAVIISAWYGGLRAGLFSTFLSVLAAVYYVLPPLYSFHLPTVQESVAVGLFVCICALISLLFEAVGRSRKAALRAAASEALQRQWFEETLTSMGDGVIATDAHGDIQFANPTAEHLTGWPLAECKGLPLSQVFQIRPESGDHVLVNPVELVLRDGVKKGLANHTLLIRRDGVVFPIDDSAAPIRDVNGKLAGVILIFRDFTEHRRHEQQMLLSRERLRLALDAAQLGTWRRDLITGEVEWSPELERLFGLEPGSFKGSREQFLDLLHPDDRPKYIDEIQAAIQERRDYRVEFRYLRDGQYRWMEGRGRAFYDDVSGSPVSMTGIGLDITEVKSIELALRKANQELQYFAYASSHDLREPLRMVSMYVQMIQSKYGHLLDEDGREFLGYARDGAKRMQALIDALLEYSQVDTVARSEPKTIKADDVLSAVLANLRLAIRETHANITRDPLPSLCAHEFHLMQLFQNLIGNAIKYRRDVAPEIHISAVGHSHGYVFAVRDNGEGISESDKDKVFGIFQRLHGREVPGAGIGLATCRKVVDQYGGDIWFESTPGVGSTFYFTLPGAFSSVPSSKRLSPLPQSPHPAQ